VRTRNLGEMIENGGNHSIGWPYLASELALLPRPFFPVELGA
jgi:hypothetical protein